MVGHAYRLGSQGRGITNSCPVWATEPDLVFKNKEGLGSSTDQRGQVQFQFLKHNKRTGRSYRELDPRGLIILLRRMC